MSDNDDEDDDNEPKKSFYQKWKSIDFLVFSATCHLVDGCELLSLLLLLQR